MNAILIVQNPIQLTTKILVKERKSMIETRFGLKYKMPHSLVHIVDNSQYTGPLPVVVAEDPSLLASIVVTGAPMGADNKMISVNRNDVLNIAYGMQNLTPDDIRRYGQSVTYPLSLIEQGGPVRLMRVTPDDATYAVSTLIIQWRIDGTDNKLHVRFKTKGWPEDIIANRFKNTDRVNEALNKYYKNDTAEVDAQGTWSQRALINYISAGRGSVYNNMSAVINMTNQSRRPANVRYEFDTIDTRTNQIVERFFASLINVNNKDRTDAIDSVNTTIARRVEGSSIIVPYVNDSAIRELYDIYMSHYKDMLDIADPNEFISNAYKAMNINIFDVIFGNYIYNGTDTAVKMPYYQVDMFNAEIPKLSSDRRICVLNNADWNKDHPQALYSKLLESTYGVTRTGDTVHVGDIYLTTNGTNTNPRISVITSINQYTGNVTSMTIPRVFPLDGNPADPSNAWKVLRKTSTTGKASVVIATLVSDITTGAGTPTGAKSETIKKLVSSNIIVNNDVIAAYKYNATDYDAPIPGFDLYTVEVTTSSAGTGNEVKTYTLHYMDPGFYYEMLDRDSHSGGSIGTGNALGFWYSKESDAAWNRPGATIVQCETDNSIEPSHQKNTIYVNSYNRTSSDSDVTNDNRLLISEHPTYGKIGMPPTTVNVTSDLVGSQFDVQVYNNVNVDKWKASGISVVDDGTGGTGPDSNFRFKKDDQFYVAMYAFTHDGVTAGSTDDPERYAIITADTLFVDFWCSTAAADQQFLTSQPSDWVSGYVNYKKYATVSGKQRIVDVANMALVTSEPSSFNPTSYYKKDVNGKYVKGSSGEAWATGKWYTATPASAPSFAELQVLSVAMANAWDQNKGNYVDTTDTSPCRTIITVTSVNDEGHISGIEITKDASYTNTSDDVEIATVLTKLKDPNNKLLAVYIDPTGNQHKPTLNLTNFTVTEANASPVEIDRYVITGAIGSLYKVQNDPVVIPANYYSDTYGINPSSEEGGIRLSGGYTGFFDNPNISDVEFKWRYSALLVDAFRGKKDPRIQSPTRCPAKFLFDGGFNTIVGSTIIPGLPYTPSDIINASIIFTDDEKEEILYHPEIIAGIQYEDIDVKQAMYDLMIYRIYQGIPEDKRPLGPGSGLSLHLDSGIVDVNTAQLVNKSFNKRFDNPNASWDIGGWVDIETGISFTFTKQIVDNLIRHSKAISINKPYVGKYSAISPDRYTSYFPDVDTTDWELRELLYNSGGNAWIMGQDGSLTRRSQRTLLRNADTSDILQENNMRTLSQLTYLLQNKIDDYLLEYNDDAVIKTLSDEVNNIFSNWVGNLVDALDITFVRDINTDGGDILICYCNVTFRGLILRVPIIVNINRREENS